MRYWIKNLTIAAIALVIIVSMSIYSSQYEWINGNFALPNHDLAPADTLVTLVHTDTSTQKELAITVKLPKGKNSVLYSMLVPDNDKEFTLTYHLRANTPNNVMRVAYLDEGGLNAKREIVTSEKVVPLKIQQLKGKIIRVNLLENVPNWESANAVVDSLFDITLSDKENAERLIEYLQKQNQSNPQVALRWLLCRADIESELFWAHKTADSPGQLMNALFLEGVYYYVDLSDPNGKLFDREELHKQYTKLVFEQGVDR